MRRLSLVSPTPLPFNWINRLRRGHRVKMVKENREASIEFAYEPPEPGYRCGIIGIQVAPGHIQSWIIGLQGEGLDGSQLLLPLDELPEPEPLPEPVIRHLVRTVDELREKIRRLEGLIPEYWWY